MHKIKKYALVLFLLTPVQITFCFGQTQSPETNFRLLTYGEPGGIGNPEIVIAKKWGIEFYQVAGCIVSRRLLDSAEQHNKVVEISIVEEYGKDWRDKFYKEVNVERKIQKKVKILIEKLEYIKMKKAEMKKAEIKNKSIFLNYIMTPVPNSTLYDVSIQGWGTLSGEEGWITYYKLLVDYKTKSTKLISDRIVKE